MPTGIREPEAPMTKNQPELIVCRDYRYLDEKGKQWPGGGGREVFKVRRLKTGAVTQVKDRFGKVTDEITMVDGYYDDLPSGKLYESHEEAITALRKMS